MTEHNPSEGDIVERLMQDRLLNPDYATRREAAAEITRLRELLRISLGADRGGLSRSQAPFTRARAEGIAQRQEDKGMSNQSDAERKLETEIAQNTDITRLGPDALYGAVGVAMFKADMGGLRIDQKINFVGNAAYEALTRSVEPTEAMLDAGERAYDAEPEGYADAHRRGLGKAYLAMHSAKEG